MLFHLFLSQTEQDWFATCLQPVSRPVQQVFLLMGVGVEAQAEAEARWCQGYVNRQIMRISLLFLFEREKDGKRCENTEKYYFNQQTAHEAPICWSKYTTVDNLK